ncbi:hypothetical protein [Pararobbsia silviterrae]|uniref:DUF2188 domain-containing protein n=1 Tax=Pararobbsia silviterrae TaxID=1792498 RepID=A0A494Y900_9BURK|nr:hypothetical protein [Pararobbsia silviterrae]RKP56390.1 hypothetical protein D7S86_08315 [Pararobbsia silviterrae]
MSTAYDLMFWIVWSPTGARPPSHRHTSRHSAIAEAERLAKANTGAAFYVLAAQEMRQVDGMKCVRFQDPEEIPF